MKSKLKLAVLLDISRAYDRELLAGISQYNKLHDKFVFFLLSPLYIHDEKGASLLQRISSWQPDGIFTREIPELQALFDLNIPIIVSPHTKMYEGRVNLWGNGQAMGKLAAEYFLSRGYKHFAFLGFKDFQWSLERQQGFVSRIGEAQYEVNEFMFDPAQLQWEELPDRLAEWLSTIPQPCALFSVTDELNIPLLEAANAIQAKVPDDFSIMGVDNDTMLCEISSPALSSVDQHASLAGFQAAQALSRWIELGEKPDGNILFETATIITRNSTNALAIEDEQVRTAMHFIANTAPSEDITVDDVVQATVLSRRVLEMKFQAVVKSSILEEIKKVRIDRIKYLLVNSKLPVQQIAVELNFRNFENITRYFKQSTGLKPLEYRNKFAAK
ncbi:MAG TPA: XylR family transcriptional regulator [Phnomibacter sp.]|nr:XylR family transcriptional regulator [Phnomibacter sp.]